MARRQKLPWGLAAALLAAAPSYAAPSVSASMSAAFPSAPYLLELMYATSVHRLWPKLFDLKACC